MADGGNVIFRFTGDTSQLNNTINTLSKSVGSAFTKIGSTIAGVTAGVVAGLGQAVSRFDTLNNYPKILSNLGIGGEEAKESINELSNAIDGLPTTLDDAALGVQRLVAKNKDVKKSTKYFTALNDAIVAGGAPAQLQASAIEQLTQSYTKGKPDMMEWRTLMQAMSGQLDQVAQKMHMASTDELYESLKNGEITMEDFMDTLVELDEEGLEGFQSFADQARNATDNIGTAITNVRNRVKKGFASMLESVNEAFKNTSIGSIATGINKVSKAMQTLLDSFGKRLKENKQFTRMIENLAKGIDRITKAVDKIDNKKMDKFVDIALGLGKLSPILIGVGKTLPKVTSKITSFSGKVSKIFGTTIPSVIGGAFSGGAVITALIGALGFLEQTTEGKLSDMITDLGKKLPSMLQKALDFLNTQLPSILQNGTKIFQGLLNMAVQNSPMIMNIITTALTQFSTTLFQNLPTILGTIQQLFISLTEQFIPQIPTILHSAVQGIMDTFVTLTNPENLSKLLQSGIDLIVKLAEGISSEVSSPDFWDKVTLIVTNIVDTLLNTENLGKMIEAGIQLVVALGKGLIYGIPHLFDAVNEIASSLATKVTQSISDIWIKIKGALTGKEDEEIKREQNNAKIWNNSLRQWGEEAGYNMNGGLFSGIKNSKGQVTDEVGSLAEKTKSSFTNPLSIFSPSRVFEGFGENIIQGLINGLWNKAGQLFNTIRNIASNVINNMKSALGIHSPSKEFAELGMYSAEGYEIGFMKQLPQLEKEIQTGMNDLVEGSFMMSPKLNQSINAQSPVVNVSVQNNMQTDFMGNLVNNIKTYSNGSRNDYNYGAV